MTITTWEDEREPVGANNLPLGSMYGEINAPAVVSADLDMNSLLFMRFAGLVA